MNTPKKYRLFICGVLLISAIACASTSKMGELKVDESVTLEAHDEVNYAWTASVEPGVEYVLSIANEEYEGSYYGFIYILDEGIYPSDDNSNLIAQGESFIPSVSFVAPEDGTVTIVISMINWINIDIEVTLAHRDN